MLKKTTGDFDGVRTHVWYTRPDYESSAQTTVPRLCMFFGSDIYNMQVKKKLTNSINKYIVILQLEYAKYVLYPYRVKVVSEGQTFG